MSAESDLMAIFDQLNLDDRVLRYEYSELTAATQRLMEESYESGYDMGYERGRESGRDSGYQEGYDIGYGVGLDQGSRIDW